MIKGLTDVSFQDGGHMLAWSSHTRRGLHLFSQLLMACRADVKKGLSHQKWKVLNGELPPHLRALRVCWHLGLMIVAAQMTEKALERFEKELQGRYILPAQAAQKEEDHTIHEGEIYDDVPW